jgi:hypothetical protein
MDHGVPYDNRRAVAVHRRLSDLLDDPHGVAVHRLVELERWDIGLRIVHPATHVRVD